MGWRLAESLKTLRTQVNALYPSRDKSSDGSIGDQGHQARHSDHNPNGANVVTAIDIDADLGPFTNVGVIVNALRSANDPRIKYIIWQGQITMPNNLARLKKYNGPNGHFHHAHISVSSNPKLYDDAKAWQLSTATAITYETEPLPPSKPAKSSPSKPLERDSKGAEVKLLQTTLNKRGFKLAVDGDFGPSTERAVRSFQASQRLRPDGKVGKATLAALGL